MCRSGRSRAYDVVRARAYATRPPARPVIPQDNDLTWTNPFASNAIRVFAGADAAGPRALVDAVGGISPGVRPIRLARTRFGDPSITDNLSKRRTDYMCQTVSVTDRDT